jgi:hypothetical protein
VLISQFGANWRGMFLEFEPKPIAAASIGQERMIIRFYKVIEAFNRSIRQYYPMDAPLQSKFNILE